jgi:hypothetical protein
MAPIDLAIEELRSLKPGETVNITKTAGKKMVLTAQRYRDVSMELRAQNKQVTTINNCSTTGNRIRL